MSVIRQSRLAYHTTWTLRTHMDAATRLPEPGDTWTADDVAPELRDVLRKFESNGIISYDERPPGNSDLVKWETKPAAYDYAQQFDTELPGGCNHRGFRHRDDGTYTCRRDDCDVELTREEARERLGGGGT